MRGYFGVGAEGISKSVNLGAMLRTAHAFGASFAFVIDAYAPVRHSLTDTSKAHEQMPVWDIESVAALSLPRHCRLVGVELTDEAILLPTFRHPLNAAYVFGAERGALGAELVARCDWIVKIPTRFCVNLGVAVAITLYDRLLCHGRFADRPVAPGGPLEALPAHVHGRPVLRRVPGVAEDACRSGDDG